MKIYVMGDIHGGYKALMQCLERSKFDYENDTLIQLGDVVDGWSEVYECVEELLKVKNLIAIKGNHDDWFNQWIETGNNPSDWKQGQDATGLSYIRSTRPEITGANKFTIPHLLSPMDIPIKHRDFFRTQLSYYIDNNNNLFIHGGFNRHKKLEEQEEFVFWWDRDLWNAALSYGKISTVEGINRPKFRMIENFKEVFIGHTTTMMWNTTEPMNAANIWNLDTGGGFKGKLTIMDINSKKYWQSDILTDLYPDEKGRI